MQGMTATPGLVAHWVLPPRVASEIKWLICYVTLSRVPSLDQLVSIGLSDQIREVLESGPPEDLVQMLSTLFAGAARLTCSEDSHAEVVLLNLPRSAAEHAESSAASLLSLLPRASARLPVHLSRLKLLSSPYRAEDSAVSLQ